MFRVQLFIPVIALGCDSRGQAYSGGESTECWDYRDNNAHGKPHTYLDAIRTGLESSASASAYPDVSQHPQLCPYMAAGQCHYGDSCPYLHGDMCEICRLQVLHPHDPEQRAAHEKVTVPSVPFLLLSRWRWLCSTEKYCFVMVTVIVYRCVWWHLRWTWRKRSQSSTVRTSSAPFVWRWCMRKWLHQSDASAFSPAAVTRTVWAASVSGAASSSSPIRSASESYPHLYLGDSQEMMISRFFKNCFLLQIFILKLVVTVLNNFEHFWQKRP